MADCLQAPLDPGGLVFKPCRSLKSRQCLVTLHPIEADAELELPQAHRSTAGSPSVVPIASSRFCGPGGSKPMLADAAITPAAEMRSVLRIIITLFNATEEDRELPTTFFPADWRHLAKTTGALL
jgi:hypothetical protein